MLPYSGSSSHAPKMPLWLNFHLNGVLLVPMFDWRWKVYEAVERLRSRYDLIGRSTGAPFLAIVYPPETEKAFNSEWHTLSLGLSPELHVQDVDALRCTCEIIDDIGLDNVTSVFADPMPGSDQAPSWRLVGSCELLTKFGNPQLAWNDPLSSCTNWQLFSQLLARAMSCSPCGMTSKGSIIQSSFWCQARYRALGRTRS